MSITDTLFTCLHLTDVAVFIGAGIIKNLVTSREEEATVLSSAVWLTGMPKTAVCYGGAIQPLVV